MVNEMNLKERAKTLSQILGEIEGLRLRFLMGTDKALEQKRMLENEAWIRLSDAEQEIEKIKGLAEETSHIMIEAEREELKQKLQFLWNTIPLDFNLDSGEVSLVGLIHTKRQWRDWLNKFEGLLKEVEVKRKNEMSKVWFN